MAVGRLDGLPWAHAGDARVQGAEDVLDRAIQLHGALGMSDDTPIARFWRENRSMRIVDGPDEVHRMTIARRECRKWAE